MPARKVPEWEMEKRKALRAEYGGHLCLAQIMVELGAKDPRTAKEWLGDMHCILVGKQKKWSVEDLAQKFYLERFIP